MLWLKLVVGGSPRLEMTPLVLIILGVSGMYCDSHSLRYYYTGVSSLGSGLPVFSAVGYVDDREIVNYNSETHKCQSKLEWMKELGAKYWKKQTKNCKEQESVFQYNVQLLMNRLNQTGGLHIVQTMYGCELRDDGSTAGYDQHGYDGRHFMYLDTKSGIYIPTMNEAQITTQRWNSPEERVGERMKNYLENICIDGLKTYINNGREDLERRVRPEVKVWGRRSGEETKLQCLVYGFHPRTVDVKWMRNGTDHIPSEEESPILPHPDGTYQIRISLEVPTREEHSYFCRVDHSSLEEVLTVIWEPPLKTSWKYVIIYTVMAVLASICVLMLGILIRRKYPLSKEQHRGAVYTVTKTSDPNTNPTSNPTV